MISLPNNSAALISKPENIFYLSNFDGSSGFVILTKDTTYLATDARYTEYAKKVKKRGIQLFDLKGKWQEKLQKLLKKESEILYEEAHMTIASLERWKKLLPKKKWKKSKGMIENERLIKSEEELDRLRKAAALGDKVLKKVLPHLKAGVSEKEISRLFHRYSQELADGISFDPIVAFGDHGAIPHHRVTDRKLKKNDCILIDQGVKHEGYMSDMTRCFFTGKGDEEVLGMYERLLKVQEAAVEMVRPGIRISDLAKTVRAMLGKEDRYFTHSLGHGIGLEVHEGPGVSFRSDTVLQAGMVITIEPGLYRAKVGGVRIEDTVIVTDTGCERITQTPKKLHFL